MAKQQWTEINLGDVLGMASNPVNPGQKFAKRLLNVHTHERPGALTLRSGYSLKYSPPSDSTITGSSFINFAPFFDRQADPNGQEIICLIQKGVVSALDSVVEDTMEGFWFWVRPYWNGTSWVDDWQWINQTIITKITEIDATYYSHIKIFGNDTHGLADDTLIGWTVYNKTKDQFAKIITCKLDSPDMSINITLYNNSWEVDDVIICSRYWIDIDAQTEYYNNVTKEDIVFHRVNHDLRIGFGGYENRPGLAIGYRKKYYLIQDINFTEIHTDLSESGALEKFATIDKVILDTAIADKNAYGIDLSQVDVYTGGLDINTYYFRLIGELDEYGEQLLGENSIKIAGNDLDIAIYPFAYFGKINPRITKLNIYKSTDNITFYKIIENVISSNKYSAEKWEIDIGGRIIRVPQINLPTEQSALTPTTDINGLGDWENEADNSTLNVVTDDTNTLSDVLIQLGSPTIIKQNAHGILDGTRVRFTSDGTLPPEIVEGTYYFIEVDDADYFYIKNEQDGARINTSGSGYLAGTHNVHYGIEAVYDGAYYFLWENTSWTKMRIVSPIITTVKQKITIQFSIRASSNKSMMKISSTGDVDCRTINLINDSWTDYEESLYIKDQLVLELSYYEISGARIGIDKLSIEISDYLLTTLEDGTEMNAEMGYTPTYDLVKGWDQALVSYNGRVYYLNPYLEKRYENYLVVSHIAPPSIYMKDIASFSNFRELEKYDSNETLAIELLQNREILILKDSSITTITDDGLVGLIREPVYGIGCISRGSVVNINGLVFWCDDEEIFMLNIGSSLIPKPLLKDTIRDLYLAIIDKHKIFGTRDNFNTYRIRINDSSLKTEYLLSENGWTEEQKWHYPEIYRGGFNNKLYFLNTGSIYEQESNYSVTEDAPAGGSS